jgi:MFS-type transporter involved in bile tolerance (Atg22 family)
VCASTGEATRLGLVSWCLYDWPTFAFPTIVTTFVLSVYFTRAVADNPVFVAGIVVLLPLLKEPR